jgi:hypothetical protein
MEGEAEGERGLDVGGFPVTGGPWDGVGVTRPFGALQAPRRVHKLRSVEVMKGDEVVD